MKIGQKSELPASSPAAAKQQAKTENPGAAEETGQARPAGAAGVPVSFSSSARALEQKDRTNADFDAERVESMRAAIADGSFRVNAEAVADKLLSNAEEFMTHTRS
ncbi:flagellar biosynthesis anti-sigma factor FlgM [Comamonas composti]|uniref:flagellar biosynthesis anti-sigma factor FlgM n=1 Tax=Comamonas composti TaxID=408558 RepID=UPI00047B1AE9|nr:flagellar biosynthesis anti-sigma factor FlgM [Comamonas composti]